MIQGDSPPSEVNARTALVHVVLQFSGYMLCYTEYKGNAWGGVQCFGVTFVQRACNRQGLSAASAPVSCEV